MDRFSWANGLLEINETLVIQQRGVRLYDGDDKVLFCFAGFFGQKTVPVKTLTIDTLALVRCFKLHNSETV